MERTPGEVIVPDGEIEINAGRRERHAQGRSTPATARSRSAATTTSSKPTRRSNSTASAAFGMRLDIPAGTAVRFEPGESKEVTLVEFGGSGET